MAREKLVYIRNTGDHAIKVSSADGKLTKRLEVARFDALSGRALHFGYTPLTATEHATLARESKLLSHFMDLKILELHETLPEEAMTPHETLVNAKREAAEQAQYVSELEAKIERQEKGLEALALKSAELERKNKALTEALAAAGAKAADKGAKA